MTISAQRITPSGTQAGSAGEIRTLTGLRIVAAGWVVAFHFHFTALAGVAAAVAVAGPLLTAGALGVDLFFVLSGYVIAHTYLTTLGPAFRPRAAAEFLWARICRMWPLYAVVFHLFGLWLLARYVFGSDGDIAFQGVQPVLSVGQWLQQLLLVQMWDNPYLDGASWVGPTWSISAEWLAYLLFPLAALAFFRLRDSSLVVLGASAVLLMAPIAWAYVVLGSPYYPWSWAVRILCGFSAGVLAHLVVTRIRRTEATGRIASRLAVVVPVLIVAGLLLGSAVAPGRGGVVILLFPVLVAVLALADRGPAMVLARPSMVFGGRISYSLYLVHIPMFEVFWLLQAYVPELGHDTVMGHVVGAAVLLGSFSVASWAYRWVEEPARLRLRGLLPRRFSTAPASPEMRAAVEMELLTHGSRRVYMPAARAALVDRAEAVRRSTGGVMRDPEVQRAEAARAEAERIAADDVPPPAPRTRPVPIVGGSVAGMFDRSVGGAALARFMSSDEPAAASDDDDDDAETRPLPVVVDDEEFVSSGVSVRPFAPPTTPIPVQDAEPAVEGAVPAVTHLVPAHPVVAAAEIADLPLPEDIEDADQLFRELQPADAPLTDGPSTDAPSTDAPSTDAPPADGPTVTVPALAASLLSGPPSRAAAPDPSRRPDDSENALVTAPGGIPTEMDADVEDVADGTAGADDEEGAGATAPAPDPAPAPRVPAPSQPVEPARELEPVGTAGAPADEAGSQRRLATAVVAAQRTAERRRAGARRPSPRPRPRPVPRPAPGEESLPPAAAADRNAVRTAWAEAIAEVEDDGPALDPAVAAERSVLVRAALRKVTG